MKKIIEVSNLVKKYGKFIAVNDVSFYVKKGEVFGLLGENGAGKTTTLEMIEGLRKPTSGEIKVLGHDMKNGLQTVKEKIGVQLQSSAYYNFLTLREILDLFGGFYKKRLSADELLGLVNLKDKANARVDKLSGGQKQRFSIVASLVNDPEVVFLDEPTTGLDPVARRSLWGLISDIKARGKTIILTTHYMEEAELLCDSIAIMEKGRVMAIDETHKLIERAQYPVVVTFITNKLDKKVFSSLGKIGAIENVFAKVGQFELKLKDETNLDQAIKLIQSLRPESLTIGRATLEDVFIEITGKNIANEENV